MEAIEVVDETSRFNADREDRARRSVSPKYRWVIVADLVADPESEPGRNANAVGVMGPSKCAERLAGEPEVFRMLDADGELYYIGLLFDPEDVTSGFEPLDEFGRPNAGCTQIEYWALKNSWEAL